MTATQIAFAFFLLVAAPGCGVCGAIAARQSRLRWFGGLGAATGAAWLGLAAAGVVARLVHSDYPMSGPPEFLTILYVAPGFVGGLLGVLALARHGESASPQAGVIDARWARRLMIFGMATAALCVALIYYLFVSPLHRALPWGAREVHESSWREGFLPDYTYCLKVRISESEVAGYAEALQLTPNAEGRVYEDNLLWLQWTGPHGRGESAWWTPPPVEVGRTYVWQGGDEWILADWKDGWLYVSAHNH